MEIIIKKKINFVPQIAPSIPQKYYGNNNKKEEKFCATNAPSHEII